MALIYDIVDDITSNLYLKKEIVYDWKGCIISMPD
jgi:hypothetical protein